MKLKLQKPGFKTHFFVLITYMVLVIGFLSGCKKSAEIPVDSNLDYDASLVNGNYLLTKLQYYSDWSGFSYVDTFTNLNYEITKLNNNRISFLNYNLIRSSADSAIISFEGVTNDSTHLISLVFFSINDSIYFYETENYFSYTNTCIYSGRKI